MKKIVLPRALPARFIFPSDPSRAENWGRLTRLSAQGVLATGLNPFQVGLRVLALWEMQGQKFEIEGRVLTVQREISGYLTSYIFFIRASDRKRLSSFLIDLLARG